MYRKVLLAYDGSPPANAALAAATVLLRGQPTELELAYVMYDLPQMKGVSKVIIDDNVIDGDGKPLLIYEDAPKVAGSN